MRIFMPERTFILLNGENGFSVVHVMRPLTLHYSPSGKHPASGLSDVASDINTFWLYICLILHFHVDRMKKRCYTKTGQREKEIKSKNAVSAEKGAIPLNQDEIFGHLAVCFARLSIL